MERNEKCKVTQCQKEGLPQDAMRIRILISFIKAFYDRMTLLSLCRTCNRETNRFEGNIRKIFEFGVIQLTRGTQLVKYYDMIFRDFLGDFLRILSIIYRIIPVFARNTSEVLRIFYSFLLRLVDKIFRSSVPLDQ